VKRLLQKKRKYLLLVMLDVDLRPFLPEILVEVTMEIMYRQEEMEVEREVRRSNLGY